MKQTSTLDLAPSQQQVPSRWLYIFLVGNPYLNLYLPLASRVRGRSNNSSKNAKCRASTIALSSPARPRFPRCFPPEDWRKLRRWFGRSTSLVSTFRWLRWFFGILKRTTWVIQQKQWKTIQEIWGDVYRTLKYMCTYIYIYIHLYVCMFWGGPHGYLIQNKQRLFGGTARAFHLEKNGSFELKFGGPVRPLRTMAAWRRNWHVRPTKK